jgi:hypothetical protein
MNTVEIAIPFPGFYNSNLDGIIEQAIESDCDWRANEGDETSYPEASRLDEYEIADAYMSQGVCDYSGAHDKLARDYLEAFQEEISSHTGLELNLVFDEVVSPREYNFSTDRLFCKIPFASLEMLWNYSSDDNHATLKETIAERHTSRDGFASFYPNTLDDWPGFEAFDANHCQTLLIAVIRKAGRPHYGNSPAWNNKADWLDPVLTLERAAEDTVSEYWSGNGGFDEFVDYEKLEAALAELRAAKIGKV